LNQEFERCLQGKKIVGFPKGKELCEKELAIARSDLLDAEAGYENQRYKWSTIQGYYSLFHAARALVYSRGYRENSHYCLSVAIRALFVEEGKLDAQAARDFLNAMNLREAADYQAEFSMNGAKAVIASAERFIEKASIILGTR
jgi:uncharacterized protein (UPF0332 family)